jgi:hypothetical protein
VFFISQSIKILSKITPMNSLAASSAGPFHPTISCKALVTTLASIMRETSRNIRRSWSEGSKKRKKSLVHVFREWDRVVFPNLDSSLVGQDKETSSGLKTAMEMLEADEED